MGLFDDVLVPNSRLSLPRRRAVQLSRPVFTRPAEWQPHEDLPELHGIVAIDSENKDPRLSSGGGSSWVYPGQGFNCGWAISTDDLEFYLPLRHSDGNIDGDRVRRWLKAQAAKTDVTFVYANCGYDLGWLLRDEIEPVNMPIDVQGMAALLDEFKFSYSLDTLGKEYLGEGKDDEAFFQACAAGGLTDPKSNMDMVPAWIAEPYGTKDANLTRRLYHHLLPMIEAERLGRIHLLERECYLVGLDMKRRGVRVDVDEAERQIVRFERMRDEKLAVVRDATGVLCSATDNASLARALKIENPSLDLPQTTQGRDSIRKEIIEGLRSPVADAINAARRYDKAINTFLKGYICDSAVNGRIHADFNPLRRSGTENDSNEGMKGTTSGRWSCTDPNLQNVPTRDPEIGPAVRACFLPEEGEQWGKLDYSAQEPRIAVHIAEARNIRGAREMADRFRRDSKTDVHQETANLMSVKRGPAKTITLGILYGAGGAEVCRRLGLPTAFKTLRNGDVIEIAGPEGQQLLDKHFRAAPWIKGLQKAAKEEAERQGWVRTLGGRRVRFRRRGNEYERAYKACNGEVQGTAADQMKVAQVRMRREGIPISLVVHDDANASIPMGDAGQRRVARIKEIMENAIPLSIPVLADVKIGENWAAVSS